MYRTLSRASSNLSQLFDEDRDADMMMKGLTMTAECAKAAAGKPGMLATSNLIALYKQEMFTCKASYDLVKKDLLASASMAMSDITCGVDCAYSAAKGTLSKYALAAQFVQPEFVVSAKCEDKGGKLSNPMSARLPSPAPLRARLLRYDRRLGRRVQDVPRRHDVRRWRVARV